MFLALAQQRLGPWSLFPVVIGGLALMQRWRSGPILLLLSLTFLVLSRQFGLDPYQLAYALVVEVVSFVYGVRVGWVRGLRNLALMQEFFLSDLALAASVLGYSAGHYRLQGLLDHLFPTNPKQGKDAPTGQKTKKGILPTPVRETLSSLRQRRPPSLVQSREILILLLTLPVCPMAAWFLWFWVRRMMPALDMPRPLWQILFLLWIGVGGALVAAGLLRSLAQHKLSPIEALMYLQEVVHRDTRREQRRLNRWLAWAWLQRRRREEKS
jgi:hypothetical protein